MSLGQAIIDTAKGNFVSPMDKRKRMNLCNECPKRSVKVVVRQKIEQCTECGCLLKWKTSMPNEECPIGKWNKIEST